MRRADVAVVVSRLHADLTKSLFKREPYRSAPAGEAIELLSVMTLVISTSKAGRPLSRSQIAIQLKMSRTKVFRRLQVLIASGRITATSPGNYDTSYRANLDFYDEIITPDVIQDWHNMIVGAVHDLAELRAALAPASPALSKLPKLRANQSG